MSLPNFFDDAPIKTLKEGEILWADNKTVLRSISSIAEEIADQKAGIVYAIYGSWGSGKSSVGRIIQDEVCRRLDPQGGVPVVFSWYYASAYQGMGDIMSTLSLRLWRDLASMTPSLGTNQVVSVYREYLRAMLGELPVEGEQDSAHNFELLEKLAKRTGNLVEFGMVLQNELTGHGEAGGGERKLVLFVDDLDRCSPEFIAALLQTLRRLTDVANLFVILLGERARILSGVKLMYPEAQSDPLEAERALEKYVNYAITLPTLDRALLTSYVRRLIQQRIDEHHLIEDSIHYRVLKAMQDHADYFWAGIRSKTPRAIKRAANAVRTPLHLLLEETPQATAVWQTSEVQFAIKRALLEYSFAEFTERYITKAESNRFAPEREFLIQLENACQTFSSAVGSLEEERDRRARFELRVNRYRASYLPTNEESGYISDELAILLAQPPSFASHFAQRDAEKDGKPPGSSRPPSDKSEPGFDPGIPKLLDRSQVENRVTMVEEFTKYYLQSEQADSQGDAAGSVRAAYNALVLVVENPDVFGADIAPQLGNLGVNAEKYRQPDVAAAIFERAHQLAPNHVGVMQQYASFIIDNREADLDKAEEMLNRLRQPPLNEEKISHTLSLLVQLYAKRGQQVDEATIEELRRYAVVEPSLRRIGSIITSLIRAGNVEPALDIFRQSRQRFTALDQCQELKRYLADALANRREERYEFIAMDLYRQMLDANEVPESELPDVRHNLATLYFKHDYDGEAGQLWFDAYNQRPLDGAIRRAYSGYLIRANAYEEAQTVSESKPLTNKRLYETGKKMPPQFSDFGVEPCA